MERDNFLGLECNHFKKYKILCTECKQIMCSCCYTLHNNRIKHETNNYSNHINTIIESLQKHFSTDLNNNNFKNDNNEKSRGSSKVDSSTNRDYITERRNLLWNTLKSSTSRYQSLTSTEKRISQYFRDVVNAIVAEEKKISGPIGKEKDDIIKEINHSINELKYLVNIANLCLIEPIDQENESQSSTFNSEIQPFHVNEQPDSNGRYLAEGDIRAMIMDNINKYCSYFDFPKESELSPVNYNVETNLDIDRFVELMQSSIKLSQPKENNSYIFSTLDTTGATLIHMKSNTVEEIPTHSNLSGALVPVGDTIYIFGGTDHLSMNKFFRFSVDFNKTLVAGEMKNIDLERGISACYDGKEHIYILSNFNDTGIHRFNTQTMIFERCDSHDKYNGFIILSFFYKEKLYFITKEDCAIRTLDPKNGKIELFNSFPSFLRLNPVAACTDGHGNIYIYEIDMFFCFNVDSKSSADLKFQKIPLPLSLAYHQDGYIYVVGNGCIRYSIEYNEWVQILSETDYNRNVWSSTIIVL
ncbi:hypothetical protein PPL_03956 [Heterostelium album PN500]|uniref:B box-type domain-containing protein n=1 Tax=Heterostelium pallidum (strain ATCC 26659 / Pp 5 / PN500) TaxID=670386 RepID=D3B5L8_HETP5|nr:hypothetical protein PPL_03956 [Heterostelium album PN500]EFA83166.1 hypothetical protein PPL_03956 [Heterostelium album PN500]|eukprot:XP_020435283.1 hypothetical protein PPL_03956 [Heterostelium album PN500]